MSLDPDDANSPHYDRSETNGHALEPGASTADSLNPSLAHRAPPLALLALALLLPLAGCNRTPEASGPPSASIPPLPAIIGAGFAGGGTIRKPSP